MLNQRIVGPVFAVLILSLSVGGVFYLQSSKPMPPVVVEREKAWPVEVGGVVYDEHRPQLTLLGHVESPSISQMTAAVEANVLQTLVNEGHRVELGQILVQLDAAETAMNLALREAEVEDLEAQIEIENNTHQAANEAIKNEKALVRLSLAGVKRERKLFKRKVGAASRLDESKIALENQSLSLNARQLTLTNHTAKLKRLQANLKRANAQLERAQLDIHRTLIVAPFSGRISKLHVSPGERVNSGSPVVDIYATEGLEIRALIPERYLAAVTLGMQKTGLVKASTSYLGEVLPLSLDRFAGEVDQGRGGTDAILTLAGTIDGLPLGKAMSIILDLPPVANALGLPVQAIFRDNRVYKVVGERLEAVAIKKLGEGLNQNGAAVVIAQSEGLKVGDRYITTQLPNPISGLKVAVINAHSEQNQLQGPSQ